MFFIRSNIPGKWYSTRFSSIVMFHRSTDDTRPSSLSSLTFCIYVLLETHSPVCNSSANSSWSYRWTRSPIAIEIIFKRSSDLHGKYSVIIWREIWELSSSSQFIYAVPFLMETEETVFKYPRFFLQLMSVYDLFRKKCLSMYFFANVNINRNLPPLIAWLSFFCSRLEWMMEKNERIFAITQSHPTKNVRQCNWRAFVWIFLMIIIHLKGILIGIIFRNDCPMEKNIPRWEIIHGFLMISFLLLIFLPSKQITKTNQEDYSHRNWMIFLIDHLKILLICFLVAWFIRGNVSRVILRKNVSPWISRLDMDIQILEKGQLWQAIIIDQSNNKEFLLSSLDLSLCILVYDDHSYSVSCLFDLFSWFYDL